MDIFEFELRYKSYEWLSTRFHLWWDESKILELVKKTSWWKLDTKLVDTSVEELHIKTKMTYTWYKNDFIETSLDIIDTTWKKLFEYIERLEYELKVTHEMWYNTYFLIVEDYISRAKENNIVVGPWRWSCAWSLMSYAIWVTDLDPLQYDLIFERFLNPARISMPDIDTDFEDTQRDKVINYITDKYGSDKVAHIWTYMKLAAKAAFKDVARVMWIKFIDANNIASFITEKTIQESIDDNKDFQKVIANDNRLKKVIEFAQALEWTVRQTWVHACWMIIAPENTQNYSVIQHPPKSSSGLRDEARVVSQYEWWTIEDIWLLKMDLLGLRNLSIIKNTIRILKAKSENEGTELDDLFKHFLDTMLFHPPLDDQFVYKKIFWKWDTSWVFQFESDWMKNWLKKLKPTGFDDLIAMVSLYRPGPMEFIPNYIDRKHEIEEVKYMQLDLQSILRREYSKEVAEEERIKMEEDLWPIMNMTYGIAVYQEQLMRMSQAIAWFSMSEADKLRKWIGKKIAELIEKIKKEFVEKAWTHRQYKPETATRMYEKMIEPAARYSFNKSHAACYAYISYQTAYLKAHYPLEFHAALLRSVEENTDKLAQFIDEIKLQWYDIELPDVQVAFEHVASINNKIYLWLLAIKWVWSDVASHIETERKTHWIYESLTNFLKRNKEYINKKTLEALITSWALDSLESRFNMYHNIPLIIDWVKSLEWWWQQAWLFASTNVEGADLLLHSETKSTNIELLKTEWLAFKTFVSGHPLDWLYTFIRGKYWFISMFKDKEWYWDFSLLWFIKSISRNRRWEWFFIKVEDISWEIEFYIKDKLDFEPFMIISVHWYMWRRPRIHKISGFNIWSLIDKAKRNGKFNVDQTVSKIRSERFQQQVVETTNTPTKGSVETSKKVSTDNLTESIEWWEPVVEFYWELKYEFRKIKTAWLKMKVKWIIKWYAWDSELIIWEEKFHVNEEWLKKINKLMAEVDIN